MTAINSFSHQNQVREIPGVQELELLDRFSFHGRFEALFGELLVTVVNIHTYHHRRRRRLVSSTKVHLAGAAAMVHFSGGAVDRPPPLPEKPLPKSQPLPPPLPSPEKKIDPAKQILILDRDVIPVVLDSLDHPNGGSTESATSTVRRRRRSTVAPVVPRSTVQIFPVLHRYVSATSSLRQQHSKRTVSATSAHSQQHVSEQSAVQSLPRQQRAPPCHQRAPLSAGPTSSGPHCHVTSGPTATSSEGPIATSSVGPTFGGPPPSAGPTFGGPHIQWVTLPRHQRAPLARHQQAPLP
ncbi:hypothetical protein ACLOJK_027769, partial [Asimina triloba]